MSLVRHLVSSDLRRFRWMILGLMALVAVSTALDSYMPEVALDRQALASMGFAAVVLWLAEGLLTALLIARVVQADRLVGTTAFWMTRPIAPLRLFAAKATLIMAVTVIWPTLCELTLMMIHHVPAGQAALGAVQDLGTRLLIMLALMSAAAMTSSVTSFAVVCASVIALAAAATAAYATFELTQARLAGTTSMIVSSTSTVAFTSRAYYDHTADIVRAALTIAAFLALIVVQYRRRSVRRAAVTGVFGIALAIGVTQPGVGSLVRAASRPPLWAAEAGTLHLAVEPGRVDVEPTADWGLPLGAAKVRARAQLTGIAPGYLASATPSAASVTLVDGSTINGLPFPATLLLSDDVYGQGQLHIVKEVLGVRSLGDERNFSQARATLLVAGREDWLRMAAGPISYRGKFDVDLTRVTLAGTLPLRRGAAFQEGSFRLVIREVAPVGGALVVGVSHSDLETVFDRRIRPSYSFYLRNQQKSEAASGWLASEGSGHMVPFFFGLHLYRSSSAGFTVSPGQLRFRARQGQTHIEADLTEEWLRDAELVVLKSEYEGTVERTLTIENLIIPPPRR
jgi:hypothetical protein